MKAKAKSNAKSLKKKIALLKLLLNTLLKFISPRNLFIIYLSQKLDKYVAQYQSLTYKKYKRAKK